MSLGAVTGTGLRAFSAKAADLTGAGISLAGRIGTLVVGDVTNGADISVGGSPFAVPAATTITARNIGAGTAIAVGGVLTSLTAANVGAATIHTPAAIGSITVTGNFLADVKIDGLGVRPGSNTLGRLTVGGTVVGANIKVAGSMGTVTAGAFLDSSLFVGFTPTVPAEPWAGGTFQDGAKLGAFTVRGLKNVTAPAFDNSFVAADTVGTVTLKSVATDNDDILYGVMADEKITQLTVTASKFRYDSKKSATAQGVGDFRLKVV